MADVKGFDQNAYWIARHARLKDDPRSVGHLGKSLEENRSLEQRLQRWAGHAARILKPYSSVFDVGCGYGRVATVFCDAGYRYVGIDVSPVAVTAAGRNEPRGTYIVGSALDKQIPGPFDLVCVLYVFVHFVKDEDWSALIDRLSAQIAPGGGILFADNFPATPERPVDHVAQRPLSDYEVAFARHGLRLDPAFRRQLASALAVEEAKLPPAYLARKA